MEAVPTPVPSGQGVLVCPGSGLMPRTLSPRQGTGVGDSMLWGPPAVKWPLLFHSQGSRKPPTPQTQKTGRTPWTRGTKGAALCPSRQQVLEPPAGGAVRHHHRAQ